MNTKMQRIFLYEVMITIKKIVMKRNTCLIVFGVLLTLMSSCKKGSENPSLYRDMLNGADATVGCNNDIYLIIPVCCNGDSMCCVATVCFFTMN